MDIYRDATKWTFRTGNTTNKPAIDGSPVEECCKWSHTITFDFYYLVFDPTLKGGSGQSPGYLTQGSHRRTLGRTIVVKCGSMIVDTDYYVMLVLAGVWLM